MRNIVSYIDSTCKITIKNTEYAKIFSFLMILQSADPVQPFHITVPEVVQIVKVFRQCVVGNVQAELVIGVKFTRVSIFFCLLAFFFAIS